MTVAIEKSQGQRLLECFMDDPAFPDLAAQLWGLTLTHKRVSRKARGGLEVVLRFDPPRWFEQGGSECTPQSEPTTRPEDRTTRR